jgi:hypothetical protein
MSVTSVKTKGGVPIFSNTRTRIPVMGFLYIYARYMHNSLNSCSFLIYRPSKGGVNRGYGENSPHFCAQDLEVSEKFLVSAMGRKRSLRPIYPKFQYYVRFDLEAVIWSVLKKSVKITNGGFWSEADLLV